MLIERNGHKKSTVPKKLFAILDFLRLFNISCFKVDK